ncbi:MAG: hypothetical protein LBS82_02090 [Spirochaetaceae bacterium]|jgi:hypothetical protein|nr:hypothetical protein [Spirochaetaceae bacterium]
MAADKKKLGKKKDDAGKAATWIVAISGLIAALAALISAITTLIVTLT